jgi:RHS repeat-associated protein
VTKDGCTTSFLYDGFGERLKKTGAAGTSLYPFGDDYEITNGQVTKYVSVEGLGVVAKRVTSGGTTQTFWLHTDRLGSIQATTDTTGQNIFRRTYRPYGETISEQGSHLESRGWIDQRNDPETGLTYLHARYYDSQIGVFLSPDPMHPAKAGVGLNRYAYGSGSPTNGYDRTGRWMRFSEKIQVIDKAPSPDWGFAVLVDLFFGGGGIGGGGNTRRDRGGEGGGTGGTSQPPATPPATPPPVCPGDPSCDTSTTPPVQTPIRLPQLDETVDVKAKAPRILPEFPSVTIIGGIGATVAPIFGFDSSVGGALEFSSCPDAGAFLATGPAAGFNVSGDVFFGVVDGRIHNGLTGDSKTATLVLGEGFNLTLTGIFSTDGRLIGGAVGAGPGLPILPVMASASEQTTYAGTIRDALGRLFGDSARCH